MADRFHTAVFISKERTGNGSVFRLLADDGIRSPSLDYPTRTAGTRVKGYGLRHQEYLAIVPGDAKQTKNTLQMELPGLFCNLWNIPLPSRFRKSLQCHAFTLIKRAVQLSSHGVRGCVNGCLRSGWRTGNQAQNFPQQPWLRLNQRKYGRRHAAGLLSASASCHNYNHTLSLLRDGKLFTEGKCTSSPS
jgi:hypothetical protein